MTDIYLLFLLVDIVTYSNTVIFNKKKWPEIMTIKSGSEIW